MKFQSRPILLALVACAGSAHGAEWRGLLDVRAVDADASRSFLDGGMGKLRYDGDSPRVSIGQAVLRGDFDVADSISASVELSADQQHRGRVVDVREAWLAWSPLPSGAWKTRVKAGFFFPPTSVELDYDSVGWVPKHTISSSAINSWIGEELRTNGIEWSARRLGRYVDAPYDIGLVAAVFNGNDPTGTLLAWRGWSISDRIGGRNDALLLPDLPAYAPGGRIPAQSRTIHPFREIDGRLGYYVGANVAFGSTLELASLRYDNLADATAIKDDQWGWRTRFSHVSAVWRPHGAWELMAQAMRGDTMMGHSLVAVDFQSWFMAASHPLGPGTATLRYDRFRTTENDRIPGDPNNERGHALALAYDVPLADNISLMTEALMVRSDRAARQLIGEQPLQKERSLVVSLRFRW
ncbi:MULTISPECIES: hypothetical protein [unclassified Duganella]|uniref:hypothetical protein n=1 Tax=unclassified Duganella TaxID=2636909 RepID=UPI0008927053|nr:MULTISPECIES: hypothetical protein [unclassified Duganella]SDG82381.1 hypothetical protein SAMN05216320_107196 [Duganella sp. OV458]SDK09797.1 hypothetical protein SAMN05428973_108196 [Duganella sp. OV510]